MIVVITKGNFAKGLINYHEKKVAKGVAEMILDSTFSRNKRQRVAAFLEHAELNKCIRKNRYVHISISFPATDMLHVEKQTLIAERYLTGMGYGDSPRVIYEHRDTGYRHFHIVTSTIDFNGKKVGVYRDHFRNQDLSRAIEKEFGLTVTQYFRREQATLQDLNAKKYSMLKAVEKLVALPETKKMVEEIVGVELVNNIMTAQLTNSEIKEAMTRERFEEIRKVIDRYGVEYKTDKQQLIERLDNLKKLSHNRVDFLQRCEGEGVYVRAIGNEVGKVSLTYGFKEKSFYVLERNLPVALRYEFLFTGKKVADSFDQSEQKKFLERIILRCLKRAISLGDFLSRLERANVKMEYLSNARGPFGLSFKSLTLKNAISIKGSDVGLSLLQLQRYEFNKAGSIGGWQSQHKLGTGKKKGGPDIN